MRDSSTNSSPEAQAARFRTTQWNLVQAAGQSECVQSGEALARLCQIYWYPLYCHVRRRGYGPEEAKDLTQEFFARLLARNGVGNATPERGRFRSFLLASLSNFLNNDWDRAHAARRGGHHELLSWDAQSAEHRYFLEPADDETPERAFERCWAMTVMETALAATKEEYARAGKAHLFAALQGCLPGGDHHVPYADLARTLGMSPGAVKVAAHRLNRRFRVQLRAVVSQTLLPGEDLEAELRHLVNALG